MKVKFTQPKATITLTMVGDLIGEETGPEAMEAVEEALREGYMNGIVDLRDVRYINSQGIGVLITLLTKFRNRGGDLFLVQPSTHVKKLLIMTKLQNIFNIVPSEEDALQELNK